MRALNLSFFKQQLSVKEFYLKIIPWRLFTFRVCPGTKVSRTNVRQSWRIGIFFFLDRFVLYVVNV